MKRLSRDEIVEFLKKWLVAWSKHDLDGVVDGFADDVVFDNWTGMRVTGKERVRAAWAEWFAGHGDFIFVTEEMVIDEEEQKVLFAWRYEGPSFFRQFSGSRERRRGVDVLHFSNGLINMKKTYSKVVVEIDGRKIVLKP